MPVMIFDLEDGLPPVSFSINGEGAQRFMNFMDECQAIRDSATQPTDAEPVCTCPSGDGSLRWPCKAHPPAAPVAVDERPRLQRVIEFALRRFIHQAYDRANQAAQDLKGEFFKPGAVNAFLFDAKDAEKAVGHVAEFFKLSEVMPVDERDAFEAEFNGRMNILLNHAGEYQSFATQMAWLAWQARAKLSAGWAKGGHVDASASGVSPVPKGESGGQLGGPKHPAKAVPAQANILPRWIDCQKGKDPLIDNLIAYIEGIHPDCAASVAVPSPEQRSKCWCHTCRPVTAFGHPEDNRMVLCPTCGNKRCPHANDHRNECTGSNEPGQAGSAYPAAPSPADQQGGIEP